ncbi:transcriptional regulator CynR [Paraburkholderia pallida]|uniref:Transcriptional regulator CynR n=1 Tax=Paraburkholderia pallida TaxID=2547399 RepID=A0A4P7D4L6_9BURK|nr:transcriptional regulator CynR [Paraburkholderia pallida]QBR03706.1 transcriptional regulator CynR [Paraburkholderia pallida]
MLPRQLRYLLAVLEHRNFTRAADALHISQPALSQQIKQLEDRLGAKLLDRSGRFIVATDAGSVYAEYARAANHDLEAGRRAIHDVENLARGELRVGFTPTFMAYLVGPLISAFNFSYPSIVISVHEMTLDDLEVAISTDELDLGIAFSTVRSSDIKCEVIFNEQLKLVISDQHALSTSKHDVSVTDLSNISLAILSRDFATRSQIDEHFRAHHITPRVALETNSLSAIVEIIRLSELATILPSDVGLQQAGLTSLELTPKIPERSIALLSRRGAYERHAATAFRKIAREVVTIRNEQNGISLNRFKRNSLYKSPDERL